MTPTITSPEPDYRAVTLSRSQGDPPEYLGLVHLMKLIHADYPELSRHQRRIIAACIISPARNDDASWIGFDGKGRPLFQLRQYGSTRYSANLRNGNPTAPTPPFQLFAHVRGEVGCAVPVDPHTRPLKLWMPAVNIYNEQQNKFVQDWLSEFRRTFTDSVAPWAPAIETVIELVQETYDAPQQ
jgi:hypothetical protein